MAILTPLMQHQKDIVLFGKPLDYFGVFSEFGTGKSLACLAYVNLFQFRKTLIVSTKTSIESTWPDEIRKHTDFKFVSLLGSKRKRVDKLYFGLQRSMVNANSYHAAKVTPMIFLINFDGVKAIFNELVKANFDFIAIDESTKIKSPKADRTTALWKLGQGINKRCILTGFPVTERLSDIYSQIKFLDGGKALGNNYYRFLNTYFTKVGYKPLPRKNAIPRIIGSIKPFCIRVTNKSLNLPPKMYKTVKVPQTNDQKRIIKDLTDYFQVEFGKARVDTDYIFSIINKALQVNDGFIIGDDKSVQELDTNKDPYLIDLIDEMDPVKNKIVIWAAYRFSVRKIDAILKKLKVPSLTLTAKTKNINATVKEFQYGKHNVLIATQRKAAESITLTSSNYAIYYSNTWSYDQRANSEARIYRKGSEKHKHVCYTDLIVDGTIEENVVSSIKTKRNLVLELKEKFGSIN